MTTNKFSFEKDYEKVGLQLCYAPEKGRFLLAKKDFNVGDLIYFGQPYVHSAHLKWQEQVCTFCFKESSEQTHLAVCSLCKIARYCSKECQVKILKKDSNIYSFFKNRKRIGNCIKKNVIIGRKFLLYLQLFFK